MAAKRKAKKKKAKKRTAKKRTTKRKAAKRKPAKRKTAKRKPAKKKAVKRKKKVAKKKAAKRKPAQRKAAKKKTKRKPNVAFMRPVTPDALLSAVVGAAPLPRTELTKKLWIYIKKNGLQDKKNRRMINADANLKKVFGGKSQVSMFEMTKLVSRHVK
ncbi:MAG: SWIB/MDM2 domain-containing protein [Gemmatimonadetes bacterium]|nr:SWIB/MDM2 domain-containing protein [Gemmatimonadota bacterium]